MAAAPITGLLLIDIQNDFCPGGSLAVGEGDQVVPVCNALVTTRKFHVLAKSQDWHPRDHISFFDNNEGAAVFSERSVPLPGPVAVAGSADVTTVKQVRNGAPSPLAHASPPPLSRSFFPPTPSPHPRPGR